MKKDNYKTDNNENNMVRLDDGELDNINGGMKIILVNDKFRSKILELIYKIKQKQNEQKRK